MILKLLKILFIFLLTALLPACAADDDADEVPFTDSSDSRFSESFFVVSQPWWDFSSSIQLDSTQVSDTLDFFPDQECLTTRTVKYALGLQQLAADVAASLCQMVGGHENEWMDFYSSYYAAFVSPYDSRPKQWQIDKDVALDGKTWPFHLLILDLPDGTVEGKCNKAIEMYYEQDFKSGIMVFSPSHFNWVSYPEKIMGHDMTCRLEFSKSSSSVENTLYVSGFGDVSWPLACKNMYLAIKQTSSGISFASIVDMPYLWFGSIGDRGYSMLMAGGTDSDNMAVIQGLCPNTDDGASLERLINSNPIETVMPVYAEQWISAIASDAASGNPEPESPKPEIPVSEIPSSENPEPGIPSSEDPEPGSPIPAYQSPAYMYSGVYMGAGREIEQRASYAKALSRAEDAKKMLLSQSPYKVSILQVEWQPAE